jgi:hypothetical protein
MNALAERASRGILAAAHRVRDGLTESEAVLVQTKPGGWADQPKIRGHLSRVALGTFENLVEVDVLQFRHMLRNVTEDHK